MNPQPDETTCTILTIIVIIAVIITAIKKYFETDGIIISDTIELGSINYNKTQFSPIVTYKPPKPRKNKTISAKERKVNQTLKNIENKLNKLDKKIQKFPNKSVNQTKQEITQQYTPLHEDCFLALRSLGMSQKESKFVVNSTFNKHNIRTVQDFLYIALGKK